MHAAEKKAFWLPYLLHMQNWNLESGIWNRAHEIFIFADACNWKSSRSRV